MKQLTGCSVWYGHRPISEYMSKLLDACFTLPGIFRCSMSILEMLEGCCKM